MKVSFLDIQSQNRLLREKSLKALRNVFDSGDFILGEEVKCFEREFAAYCGNRYAVGMNSGTDALFLALLGLGIGRGDEVICPVYTYIATALSVSYTGAKPVFVDIDGRTFNLDPQKIEKKIHKRTKAIIPVHLYGQPAAMPQILKIARAHKLKVIEDAAQAHGAQVAGRSRRWQKAGTMGDIGCFSFYPTKNLNACGDAGCAVTDNRHLYKRLLMLRDQGRRGKNRYLHHIRGYNCRLDSLQAAVLRVKLQYLERTNRRRREQAYLYSKILKEVPGITIAYEPEYARGVFHIYPVLARKRDFIYKELRKRNIHAGIVYRYPLHLQPAYKDLGYRRGDFPVAERIAREILCLPMHPYLTKKQTVFVGTTIKKLMKTSR